MMSKREGLAGRGVWLGLGMWLAACTATAGPNDSTTAKEAKMADGKVVVRVRVQIKPEQVAAFTEFVRGEAQQARRLPGCDRYEVFRAADGSDGFLFYEEWASREAFSAYQQSPLLKQSFQVLGPMMAGPPDSAYYLAERFE